jgi:cbb3-type cytochrome oxidase maturation protein
MAFPYAADVSGECAMIDFFFLIPVALALGAVGLAAFIWSLRSGQYEDLDGAAERILFEEEDAPARPASDDR